MTMTGTRDTTLPQGIRHTLQPDLADLNVSSPQSPTTDRYALLGVLDIDSTRLRVREPMYHPVSEPCVPASGTKRANGIAMHAAEHGVRFYETDAFLLDAVATYCADAILAHEAALVVATPEHRAGIAERLQARRLLDAAGNHDSYLSFDAAETLSRFMVNGEVDGTRFMEVIGGAISRAAKSGHQVRVFGEMVSLLVADGNPAAALRLEELWNDLQRAVPGPLTPPFSLFCAYPMTHFGGEAHQELFNG